MNHVPAEVEVEIEVSAGSFLKRGTRGLDFVSPVPCPFNYGGVPGLLGGDGDPLDAVVLGRRLPRGSRAVWPVRGVIHFVDAGQVDDKLVCSVAVPGRGTKARILAFFRIYGACKRVWNRLRGLRGPTGVRGWQWR